MTPSSSGIRYAHTNVMANDWKKLQDFYVEVFGCEPISSERDHKGPTFEALTGLHGGSFASYDLPGVAANARTVGLTGAPPLTIAIARIE